VIWVTDGAANSPEVRASPSIRLLFPILARETDETIRRVRRAESLSLMRAIGVPEEDLHFLGYPSGRIMHCFGPIVDSLRSLLAGLAPAEVYTVAYDQSEFEHDACNAAVQLASRDLGRGTTLFEFPVFNNYKGVLRFHWLIPWDGVRVERTPFSAEEEARRLALFRRAFRSQRSVAWLERLAGLLPSDYRRLGEPYRRMPCHDYSRPLRGARVMYVPKSLRFRDFSRLVAGTSGQREVGFGGRPAEGCVAPEGGDRNAPVKTAGSTGRNDALGAGMLFPGAGAAAG
jgi:LmbE family N-acetylglucosaminyl deacetylase